MNDRLILGAEPFGEYFEFESSPAEPRARLRVPPGGGFYRHGSAEGEVAMPSRTPVLPGGGFFPREAEQFEAPGVRRRCVPVPPILTPAQVTRAVAYNARAAEEGLASPRAAFAYFSNGT